MLAQIADNLAARRIAAQAAGSIDFRTLKGTTGTQIHGGIITGEDENDEWEGENAVLNANRMRRSDPRVRQSSMLIKTPILGGQINVVPASEERKDIEVAEYVEDVLGLVRKDKERQPKYPNYVNFHEIIRHQLLYLDFGHSILEKSYKPEGGRMIPWRWQYRKPTTLFQWFIDKNSDLERIGQQSWFGDEASMKPPEPMPMEQILYTAYGREGLDFDGVSILRPAWWYWQAKQSLLANELVKFQRFSGIPEIEVSGTKIPERAIDVVKKIYNNEEAYLARTSEFKVGIFGMGTGGQGAGISSLELIKFCDFQIIIGVMANFMVQGEQEVGTYDLTKIKADMFFTNVAQEVKNIETVWNGVDGRMSNIRQIVDFGGWNVKQYPKIEIDPKEIDDLDRLSDRIAKYSQAGAYKFGDKFREWLGERENFPQELMEDIEDELEPGEEEPTEPQEPMQPGKTVIPVDGKISAQARGKKVTPEMLAFENRFMAFADMRKALDGAKQEMEDAVKTRRNQMVNDLLDDARRILGKAKSVKDVQDMISKVNVSGTSKLVNSIVEKGKDLFKYGSQTVRDEVGRQRGKMMAQAVIDDPTEAFRAIRPLVQGKVDRFAALMKSEWSDELVDQYTSGRMNLDQLRESLNRVSMNKFNNTISGVASKSFGMGRNSEMAKYPAKRIIRSEILDDATCGPCLDIDGMEFSGTDDPAFAQVSNGPYSQCDGKEACRGVNMIEVE